MLNYSIFHCTTDLMNMNEVQRNDFNFFEA